ncbi:MAG: HAD family hydrolase [Desulfobacterales bacterium]|nr:HAD family hydrolase [Desulfobacterales bacterium]
MLNKRTASRYLKPLKPIPTSLRKSGKPLTGIDCVLFDIYGTLLISASGDISLSQNKEQPTGKIEDLIQKYRVESDPQTLMNALDQAIAATHRFKKEQGILFPEVEIDRIWMQVLNNPGREFARKFAVEYELTVNPVYPMPHLEELLQTCRSKKIRMGLISNAQFYTPYLFKWLLDAAPEDLGFHPHLIFLSYQMGVAKPSPELFQKAADALNKMNIQTRAVLFMGNDMLNDILPAKRAGFKTALFAGDIRSLRLRKDDPRCQNLSPDIVLTDLNQLFEYI